MRRSKSTEELSLRVRFSAPVLHDLTIDRHGEIFARLHILKLHYLVSFSSKLAPAAGFLSILFDCLNLPAIDCDPHRSQPPSAHALYRQLSTLKSDLRPIQELCRD